MKRFIIIVLLLVTLIGSFFDMERVLIISFLLISMDLFSNSKSCEISQEICLLTKIYFRHQHDSVVNEGNKLIKQYKSDGDDYSLFHALFITGRSYQELDKFDLAIVNYLESIRYFNQTDKSRGAHNILACYENLGSMFSKYGKHEQAEAYFKDGLGLAIGFNHDVFIGRLYYRIGKEQRMMKDYMNAIDNFFLSSRYSEKAKDDNRLIRTNNQLGLLFKDLEDFVKAREHFLKMYQFHGIVKNPNKWAGMASHNIAQTYLLEGDTLKALDKFKQAIDYKTKSNSKSSLFITYMDYAEILYLRGVFNESLVLYTKALDVAKYLVDDPDYFKIFKQMSLLYADMGNIDESIKYHMKYTSYLENYAMRQSNIASDKDSGSVISLDEVTTRYSEFVAREERAAAIKFYLPLATAILLLLIVSVIIVLRSLKSREKASIEREIRRLISDNI